MLSVTDSVVEWSEFLATNPEARIRFPALPAFWEAVDLERGTLSIVNTIEELPERKSSSSGLESREYGHRDPSRWPRGTPLFTNVCNNFTDNRQLLGRYSSLADSGHGVQFLFSF
jgi:hypothetical protein